MFLIRTKYKFDSCLYEKRIKVQIHTFHLVQPSPWPFVVSVNLWNVFMGLISWFNWLWIGKWLLYLSLLNVIYIAHLWWRDVARESSLLGHHTKKVQDGIFVGMILFVISEICLFFGLFWAFVHHSLMPPVQIGSVWPPVGVEVLDPFEIPLLNTLILLSSGATVTYAHFGLLTGDKKAARNGLVWTIILAVLFTSLQGYEYVNSSFNITDSVYSSAFYLLTEMHGFHVIVGTLFLTVCLLRLNDIRPNHHQGFELASIYWHFVDIVWLIVFSVVYYWGS